MELAGQISLYLLTPLIFEVVAGQSGLRINNAIYYSYHDIVSRFSGLKWIPLGRPRLICLLVET
jgi:hypothetical protein